MKKTKNAIMVSDYELNEIREKYRSAKHKKSELSKFYGLSRYELNKILYGVKPDMIGMISEEFRKAGYELLSEEYVNQNTPLKYRCPKHGVRETTWLSFKKAKTKCLECHLESIQPTIEEVMKAFSDAGYKLLSKEYINSTSDLIYECPKHGIKKITWNNFYNNKSRCKECHLESIQPTIEGIRQAFGDAGYELLSEEYVSTHRKLKYKCPIHGEKSISWNNFKSGFRCRDCYLDKIQPSIELINDEFNKVGFKLLSNEYVNAHTKLKYVDKKGIISETTWNNFKKLRA